MSKAFLQLTDEVRETAAMWCLRLSEGALDAQSRLEFETWLSEDPERPALFGRTVAAWQAVEDQSALPELVRQRSTALENFTRNNGRRWARRMPAARKIASLAACLLMLLGAGIWWQAMPLRYETGIGERRVVALADGSMLSLDASSRVDVRYRNDRRQLWLVAGRAKFSVAKDLLRPFSVQAGERIVIATGTQFSVERLPGQVRVLLYEGRVAVLDTSRGEESQPLRVGSARLTAEQALRPGREMVIATAEPVARIDLVEPGRSSGWEGGLLEFDNEPLGIAVERMNRYGATKLQVGDNHDASIPISGQFNAGDIDAFVQGVSAVFPVRAVRQNDGTILLHATRE